MNKYELFNKITKNLKEKGYAVNIIFNDSRSNPLFEICGEDKKSYITVCEVGKKLTDYPDRIFSHLNPKIQKYVDLTRTFIVIIDYQNSPAKFIWVKFDQTNYGGRKKDDYLLFSFYRKDYGGFFNTSDFEELLKKIISE